MSGGVSVLAIKSPRRQVAVFPSSLFQVIFSFFHFLDDRQICVIMVSQLVEPLQNYLDILIYKVYRTPISKTCTQLTIDSLTKMATPPDALLPVRLLLLL